MSINRFINKDAFAFYYKFNVRNEGYYKVFQRIFAF